MKLPSVFPRYRVLSRVLLVMIALAGSLLVGLFIADHALKNPVHAMALQDWMERTRYVWLLWRLAVYMGIAWGICSLLRNRRLSSASRQSIIRLAVVSGVFTLLCELVISGGAGAW